VAPAISLVMRCDTDMPQTGIGATIILAPPPTSAPPTLAC
jgi:hypothetical protein